MPLIQSGSKKALKQNIKTEMDAHPGKSNMKKNLAIAYATKEKNKGKKYAEGGECPECASGKCAMHMAEGGEVSNEKMHPEHEASPKMPLVDEGMDSEEASDLEKDPPQLSMDISLSDEIMKDRKRLKGSPDDVLEGNADRDLADVDEYNSDPERGRQQMAKGGLVANEEVRNNKSPLDLDNDKPEDYSMVGAVEGPIDSADGSDESNNADELDAPREDGRGERGLNLEPVHVMKDDEHDQSDASLVSEILRDRKNRRRG